MPQKKKLDIKAMGQRIQKNIDDVVENVPSMLPPEPVQEVPRARGRKKTNAVNLKLYKTMYFDENMFAQLENVGYNNRVSIQSVMRTALWDFFQKYYQTDTDKLNADGMKKIDEFEDSIRI